MSPPSEKVSHASGTDTNGSSCGCRRCNVTSGGRLAAVVSCVVPVCVLVCLCFSCWTYVRIVQLQTELAKCRCAGPEETWREHQVFSEGKTGGEQRTGQSSLGAVPTSLVYPTDEYEEDIYPNMANDVHDYRTSNSSSVHHVTPRMHRRDTGMERGSRRRRCRRKGRRQKAQPHVHYETAEYSVVNVAGTVRFWQPSDWFAPEGCWFVLKNGQVRVKEPGVYWIYAQVTFEAGKDAARSRVLLGGRGDRPPTPVLTCAGPGQGEAGRGTQACFVAGIKRLDRNDRISVEAWGDVKASPDYTYFGLLKLGI